MQKERNAEEKKEKEKKNPSVLLRLEIHIDNKLESSSFNATVKDNKNSF